MRPHLAMGKLAVFHPVGKTPPQDSFRKESTNQADETDGSAQRNKPQFLPCSGSPPRPRSVDTSQPRRNTRYCDEMRLPQSLHPAVAETMWPQTPRDGHWVSTRIDSSGGAPSSIRSTQVSCRKFTVVVLVEHIHPAYASIHAIIWRAIRFKLKVSDDTFDMDSSRQFRQVCWLSP